MFDFGNLAYCGGLNTTVLPSNVVSMATLPTERLLAPARRRLVYAFGDAKWYGDFVAVTGAADRCRLGPSVGIAATLTERAISSSRPTARCTRSVMLTTAALGAAVYRRGRRRNCGRPVTGGYWLVTSKGAVYPEGAVINYGSASALQLKSPIVAIAAALNGSGYWLAAQNGDVYSYGVATGTSESHVKVYSPVVAFPRTRRTWVLARLGGWRISNNGTPAHTVSTLRRPL